MTLTIAKLEARDTSDIPIICQNFFGGELQASLAAIVLAQACCLISVRVLVLRIESLIESADLRPIIFGLQARAIQIVQDPTFRDDLLDLTRPITEEFITVDCSESAR